MNFHGDTTYYMETFLNAYSLVNVINDLEKKNDKKILLLGSYTPLFMTYLSSILYYATKDLKNFKFDLFTVKSIENGKTINLQR